MATRTWVLFAILVALAGAALAWKLGSHEPVVAAPAPMRAAAPEPAPTEYPRLSDGARVLGPFAGRLARMADAFSDDLGIDLHVVTRDDTSATIEQQTSKLFEERGIGKDAPTGGVLVLLNPKLASARIELGYSLEPVLTDLLTSRIARDQLAPYTSYGAAGMAVMDVLHALRDQIYLAAATGGIELGDAYRAKPEYLEYQRFVSGGAGAKAALSSVPLDADLKQAVPADRRTRYAPAPTPEGSVEAFLRATEDLAGDPTLDLFNEGSREQRRYYPLARFEELQRAARIHASQPLEIRSDGDYAVATSKHPATGFVPILLHRDGGVWRVDLVETWKNLFFEEDGNYRLRNSNTPYAFGLAEFGEGRPYDIAPLPLEGHTLADEIASLDGKTDAASSLRRGELWLRNAFVFPQAYLAYESAGRAAPQDPIVLETLGDRALYLGFPEIAIPALEPIGRGVELDLAQAYNETGDAAGAERWAQRALDENPHDVRALNWLKFLAERGGRSSEAERYSAAMAELSREPSRSAAAIVLSFDPKVPKFDAATTVDIGGTKVYDHSNFGVTMRNPSRQDVEIESVTLASAGTAAASGLGDIRGYWQWPAVANRLPAGESIAFSKLWGFMVKTGHQHVRYVFHTCWHGVESKIRQCRTQWVDVLP